MEIFGWIVFAVAALLFVGQIPLLLERQRERDRWRKNAEEWQKEKERRDGE